MNAAVVNVLGQAPKFQSYEEPAAGENERLVRVRAAGLHPVVKARASGEHYSSSREVPMVPGLDGVGTLEDGSRVFFAAARQKFGSMAELSVAARGMCIPLPDGIGDLEAAAIVNPGMSAWLSLKERAALTAGETVLVNGATGVAGQLAVQAARHLGARRIVATGRNVGVLAGLPIDAVIAVDQGEEGLRAAFAAEVKTGIDVVIDYLWGRPTELLLEALAKGFNMNAARATRLVEVGASAGREITLPGEVLRSVDLSLKGSGFGSVPLARILEAIPTLFSMAAAGSLKVAVEPVPLADVEAAWSRSEKGKRIVFTM
jgi:NADPH:quinone reductase-like Zn-dependent oxidoreductase